MFYKLAKVMPVFALALALALALIGYAFKAGASPAAVTTAPSAQTVIVSVNGQVLTAAQVNAYVRLRTHHSHRQVTPQQRRAFTEELVQITLAAQAAKNVGIENIPAVRAELQLQNSLYLANESVRRYVNTHKPSDKVLEQKYMRMLKKQPDKQYKARNILVSTEADAQEIIDRLGHEGNFAALAKKYSLDKESSQHGGELGWLSANQKEIPKFASIMAKLKPGQYTKTPVRTRDGWQIILLEQERMAPRPNFSAVKPVLVQQAKRDASANYLNQLQSEAHIVWHAPGLAPSAQSAVGSNPAPGNL